MSKKNSKAEQSPRDRIVATAVRLFNKQGVHTTGIDQIIAESGVAKRTFYNHFGSKNKVIAAYFAQKDAAWFLRLETASSASHDPVDRVLGLFDGLKEWFLEKDFSGCTFIRGLSDFGHEQSDPELVRCVDQHFARTVDLISRLVGGLDLKDPSKPKDSKALVAQIMSLIAGATILAHATGDAAAANVNKDIARKLLES